MKTLLYYIGMEMRRGLDEVDRRAHGRDVLTPKVHKHAGLSLSEAVTRWAKSAVVGWVIA